jgi:hypothetical protein
MINPNEATYLFVTAEEKRGEALIVNTGFGREFVPLVSVLMWNYDGRFVIACPDWVMEQKPGFSKCERFENERPYDFMMREAELLPYWIIPAVLRF